MRTLCMLMVAAALGGPMQESPGTRPASRDLASPGTVVDALYEVISGPAEQERDWERFRTLFEPGARLWALRPAGEGGSTLVSHSPDSFIEAARPLLQQAAFHERELARRTERFGPLVQVFSTYGTTRGTGPGEQTRRGINSIQMRSDGRSWRILGLAWTVETPAVPLPPRYLPEPPKPEDK